MAEPVTAPIDLGDWRPASLGLLARHVGRRIRLTVDHPGRIGDRPARGQTFEGRLDDVGPSDVSSVYASVTFTEDDGQARTLSLPLGHAVDVLHLPDVETIDVDDAQADALVAEAVRRYEADPRFRARAGLAARLSERTEYRELDGAVLVGAVLALVVDDHPELIP